MKSVLIKLHSLLFACLLCCLSCNTKKQELIFSYPIDQDAIQKSVILSEENNLDSIVKQISNNLITPQNLNKYFSGLKQRKVLVDRDSLLPRYWSKDSKTFLSQTYTSLHWGEVKEMWSNPHSMLHEGKDSVEYVNTKRTKIKALVSLPQRGIIIHLEIPIKFHYSAHKKNYEYSLSAAENNSCWVNISGPYLGDLNFQAHEILNLFKNDGVPSAKKFDAFVEGLVMVNERRWQYDFDDGKKRFVYQANMMDLDFQRKIKNEYKVLNKSSELYQLDFNVYLKTPALKNIYGNQSEIPKPIYVVTVKTKYLGIPFN